MENTPNFEFKKESSFLIDLRKKNYPTLVQSFVNFNDLIPKEDEIFTLKAFINDFKNNEIELDEYEEEINILPEFKNSFFKFAPGIKNLNKYKIIDDIIQSFKRRENITLKRICSKYEKMTNHTISKTQVYYILKNKIGYKYLKTTVKSNILANLSSKIRAFIFIKIVIRALFIKINIIFIDETNFQLENNHLKIWRHKNESPYFNSGNRGRKNIIMAISSEEILHYEINSGTNNTESFHIFMKKLIEKINPTELKYSLFIMDNCSIHLTKKLRDFYNENKLKILTIVPYLSQFNGIEFFFNYIKQKLYKKVFNSFNKMIPFVEKILNDEQTKEIIAKIFIKTINEYEKFINDNKNIDLNKNK